MGGVQALPRGSGGGGRCRGSRQGSGEGRAGPGDGGHRDQALSPTAAPPAQTLVQVPPTVLRRLAALVYESLLVAAILFFGAAIATAAARGATEGAARLFTQAFLWVLLGAYFVLSWRRGGRTLALKAWHLRVVDAQGGTVSWGRAVLRYFVAALVYGAAMVGAVAGYRNGWTPAAAAALLPAVLTIAYGFFDPQGRFLHDRLTGTKIVHERPLAPAPREG